jgi:glycosyltransferase involved in cell wall biosynthesis
MKVAFLIRSLEVGGAERQLAYLATGLKEKGVSVTVGVFYRGGVLEELLRNGGVTIEYLDKKGRWDLLGFFQRTTKWIRRENPDILHGYLTGANIVAIMVKPLFSKLHIVWGVRASNMLLDNYDQLARFTFRLSVQLSKFADLIIVNSNSGYDYHLANGYPNERMIVIHNGIDTNLFTPDLTARQQQRTAWNIGDGGILVGIIGRLDPMKDHKTFLQAIGKVLSKKKDVQFICVGNSDGNFLEDLQHYSVQLGISEKIQWEPANVNVENVYNALDVLVSTSAYGEGFSNTLAEAMACGVRCVATDVGDARKVLSDTGVVVTPGNSSEVADGILAILGCDEHENSKFKKLAIEHIRENYSIERLVSKTFTVFQNQLQIEK